MNIRLVHRAALSFSFIAFITAASFYYFGEYRIRQVRDEALIINIAGRQRMLSQRITKSVLELSYADSPNDPLLVRDRLSDSLEEWSRAHEFLFGAQGLFPRQEQIFVPFSSLRDATRTVLSEFSSGTTTDIADARRVILQYNEEYLSAMNSFVVAYTDEVATRAENSRLLAYVVGCSILFSTLLLWLFVVRPAIRDFASLGVMKSDFIALASHELRTPITEMRWGIENVITQGVDTLTDEQRGSLRDIERGCQRLEDLANMFLIVARADLGVLGLQYETFALKGLVHEVIEGYLDEVSVARQKFSFIFDDDIRDVSWDKKMTRMVIDTLFSNAAHYTPKGGSLHLRIAHDALKKNIVITMQDSGIGIPKQQLRYLFSRLFRADNAKSFHPQGRGLSLYVLKEYLSLIGGSVAVDSVLHEGTTFTVTIPVTMPQHSS